MSDFLSPFTSAAGFGSTALNPRFDAERDTPELIDAATSMLPSLRDIMASLRRALPLAPHSGVGPLGRFFRIPNHYRSISFVIPPLEHDEAQQIPGAIVFKGTEPLLPDFPQYLEWMLGVPFRANTLPLALHFALELKLPPAAMWIEECVIEQKISSNVQLQYLRHYGRLARLPLPLFVYQLTPEQVARYEAVVCERLSREAFSRIEAKVAGGLGIEVYYYSALPVRAADLFVREIRKAFRPALHVDALETTFSEWTRLLSEMLHLGFMPYAPWNHRMGACVDPGNACIDGGFNDLLTIVPFESIPTEHLFRRSLSTTMQLLGSSITAMCSLATKSRRISDGDPMDVGFAYVAERLRVHIQTEMCQNHESDARLRRCFDAPTVHDVIHQFCEMEGDQNEDAQFIHRPTQAGMTPHAPSHAAAGGLLGDVPAVAG